MSKTLKKVRALQYTYTGNSLIYYIKRFPLIGRAFPDSLYASPACKTVVKIISMIINFFKIFLGKFIYALILFLLANTILSFEHISLTENQVLINTILFCTFGGAIGNCFVLDFKKEHEYAITFMRMDTKKVVLSGFFEFLIKMMIGFLPVYIFLPQFNNLGLFYIIPLLVILISGKILGGGMKLWYLTKKANQQYKGSSILETITAALLAITGFVISFFNIAISQNLLFIIAGILVVACVFPLVYLLKYKDYHKMYKRLLLRYNTLVAKSVDRKKLMTDATSKYIQEGGEIDSKKSGYAYLSECFMQRHRKLLYNSTKKIIIGEIILVLAVVIGCLFSAEFKALINETVVGFVSFLTYFFCFLNCGERMTKVIFMNCDNEMLTYRFYRQPKAILEMFKLRLKAVFIMDWFQSLPIALGLPIILLISGGTPLIYEYIVLFISIMAMSTFFSVHNLVIYYIFQPYNKDVQMKNPVYSILKGVTYFGCYILMQSNPPFAIFGIILIVFCILYTLVSIPIAYKLAPKNFKLR